MTCPVVEEGNYVVGYCNYQCIDATTGCYRSARQASAQFVLYTFLITHESDGNGNVSMTERWSGNIKRTTTDLSTRDGIFIVDNVVGVVADALQY